MSRTNRAIRRQQNHTAVGPYPAAPDSWEEGWERIMEGAEHRAWAESSRDAPAVPRRRQPVEPYPNRVVLRNDEVVPAQGA